jgi:hypothetical protein
MVAALLINDLNKDIFAAHFEYSIYAQHLQFFSAAQQMKMPT